MQNVTAGAAGQRVQGTLETRPPSQLVGWEENGGGGSGYWRLGKELEPGWGLEGREWVTLALERSGNGPGENSVIHLLQNKMKRTGLAAQCLPQLEY